MSMSKAVPLSQFRANSAEVINGLSEMRGYAYLTRNGYSVAVVVDVDEFERIMGYAMDRGYVPGGSEGGKDD